MNPNTVFSASLVTSLVLWFPSMQACLRGDLDLAPAGLRYIAALVVSRLALGGLARLINAYHAGPAADATPAGAPPSPSAAPRPPASEPAPPQRRRTDRDPEGDADPTSMAA
jgi:hypothetical protein